MISIAYWERGEELLQGGDPLNAYNAFRKSLDANNTHTRGISGMKRALEMNKMAGRAGGYFRTAAKMSKTDPDAAVVYLTDKLSDQPDEKRLKLLAKLHIQIG